MKCHRLSPDFKCKHCHNGFGSPSSKWNHEQRCLSNPEIIKQLKMMKKQNKKLVKEEKELMNFIKNGTKPKNEERNLTILEKCDEEDSDCLKE